MPRKINRIACIGEVMIELIVGDGNAAMLNVAGDTYNTAVYLSRLLTGQGVEVSYVTVLGQDSFSDRVTDHMAQEGLSTRFVERRDDKTVGLYAIETDAQGERSFSYWRSDSAARTLFSEDASLGHAALEDVDLVFLSGITLAVMAPESRAALMTALDAFRARGGLVAYDSNHRPALWADEATAQKVNRELWERTDIALPSVDDEMLIWGDPTPEAARVRLQGYGLQRGALKRGPLGPASFSDEDVLPAFDPVKNVVDTTAAGDSFNAGFLSQIALGLGTQAALRTGHAIASQVIQAKGAIVEVTLPDLSREG